MTYFHVSKHLSKSMFVDDWVFSAANKNAVVLTPLKKKANFSISKTSSCQDCFFSFLFLRQNKMLCIVFQVAAGIVDESLMSCQAPLTRTHGMREKSGRSVLTKLWCPCTAKNRTKQDKKSTKLPVEQERLVHWKTCLLHSGNKG